MRRSKDWQLVIYELFKQIDQLEYNLDEAIIYSKISINNVNSKIKKKSFYSITDITDVDDKE